MSRSCLANTECDSGFCKNAQCVEPTKVGDPCKMGRCPGLKCDHFTWRCVSKDSPRGDGFNCRTSADCMSNLWYCDNSGKCQLRHFENSECDGDESCHDGDSCFSGVCRKRCLVDRQCGYGDKCYSFEKYPYNLCFKEDYGFSPGDPVARRVNSTQNWPLVFGVGAICFILIAVVLFVLLRRRAKRVEAANVMQSPQPYAVYPAPGPTGPSYQSSPLPSSIPQLFAPGEAPPSYNEVPPGSDHNEKSEK